MRISYYEGGNETVPQSAAAIAALFKCSNFKSLLSIFSLFFDRSLWTNHTDIIQAQFSNEFGTKTFGATFVKCLHDGFDRVVYLYCKLLCLFHDASGPGDNCGESDSGDDGDDDDGDDDGDDDDGDDDGNDGDDDDGDDDGEDDGGDDDDDDDGEGHPSFQFPLHIVTPSLGS